MENTLANVLRGSFRKWCGANDTRKEQFKKLPKEIIELIDLAFGELKIYGPGPMWTWYVRNHMKFKVKNEELRIGMNLCQEYLADYAHGRLKLENDNGGGCNKTGSGKASDSRGRSELSHGISVNTGTKKPVN
jgi:hypothetical protein